MMAAKRAHTRAAGLPMPQSDGTIVRGACQYVGLDQRDRLHVACVTGEFANTQSSAHIQYFNVKSGHRSAGDQMIGPLCRCCRCCCCCCCGCRCQYSSRCCCYSGQSRGYRLYWLRVENLFFVNRKCYEIL